MNKRIRKKQAKIHDNSKLTGGCFTKTNSKVVRKKKLFIIPVIIILVGVIFSLGVSYAYLYTTLRGSKTYSLKVKGFSLKLTESGTSNIKIENSTPVADSIGKQTTAYNFSVSNEDNSQTGYIIYLDDVSIDDEINRMKDVNVKYQLIENGVEKVGLVSELGASPFRILTNGIIGANTTNTYSLRFWIKEGAEVATNQVFNVKINLWRNHCNK